LCQAVVTYVLLVSSSIGVLILLRCEEIHVRDSVEQGCGELGISSTLRVRREALDCSYKQEKRDETVLHIAMLSITKLWKQCVPRAWNHRRSIGQGSKECDESETMESARIVEMARLTAESMPKIMSKN